MINKVCPKGDNMETIPIEEVNLRIDMRRLWGDHAMWTRMLIASIAADRGDLDNILRRLRKNQEDIGNAVGRYYRNESISKHPKPEEYCKFLQTRSTRNYNQPLTPEEKKWLSDYQAGNMLTIMLKNSITILKNLVIAKKKGDINMGLDTEEALKENAVSIASFLCGINPNWPHEPINDMLSEYLNLIREEVLAHINKNYDADLAAYDKAHEKTLIIADTLTEGIVKQYPAIFGKEEGSLSEK